MKRGEVWTAAAGGGYVGKPRPAIILQDDRFDTDSVTLCAFTTNVIESQVARPLVEPTRENGLRIVSRVMVDKVMTVPRSKLGHRIGVLGDQDMTRLNSAIVVFLGLAG